MNTVLEASKILRQPTAAVFLSLFEFISFVMRGEVSNLLVGNEVWTENKWETIFTKLNETIQVFDHYK